jgi:hypothetical protein
MGKYETLREFVYDWIGKERALIFEFSGEPAREFQNLRRQVEEDINPLLIAKGEEPIDPMDREIWLNEPGFGGHY